jgi:hypothetical protein
VLGRGLSGKNDRHPRLGLVGMSQAALSPKCAHEGAGAWRLFCDRAVVVSFHLRLDEEMHCIITAQDLAIMKHTALLVNTINFTTSYVACVGSR